MGCNGGKLLEVQKTIVVNSVVDCIERNDCSRIKDYLEIYASLDRTDLSEVKDKYIIHHREMKFSVLSFCLWNGKAISFKYCLERLGCSFEKVEESYQSIHIFPINYICEQGMIELLKVYLPYYLGYLGALDTSQRSFSARLDKQKDNYSTTSNAVQLACYNEHISILCYVKDFFNHEDPPNELDLHYVDPQTGDNCALIACRSSNLSLLKVVHEKIHANFHIKNLKREGALDIMAEASVLTPQRVFLPCFVYLVENVRVDLKESYERVIEMLTDIEIIHYLQRVYKKFSLSRSEGESFLNTRKPKEQSSVLTFDEDLSEIIKASYEGSILI